RSWPLFLRAEPDEEEPQRVRTRDGGVEIEDEGPPCLHRNAGKAGGVRLVHRVGTDRGQVGTLFLPRLAALDQRAALLAGQPAMAAHGGGAFQKSLRAFDSFESDRTAAYGDGGLSDIQPTYRDCRFRRCADVAPVAVGRPVPPQLALRRDKV